MRISAALVLPVALFCAIELLLRLFGYGYPTSFFVPAADGKMLTTNPKFAWQFYPRQTATSPTPIVFPVDKSPGTRRIFVLGESAAAGTPDPAFGFARMLNLMLAHHYPSNRFEVLNVAMRGIDSHIVRRIARECAGLSPDLFVIYMGNNDMIGLHSPSPGQVTLTSDIRWLRLKDLLHGLKLAQLGKSLLASMSPGHAGPKQDQPFFRRQRLAFDDPLREPVYQNYALNLRDICDIAQGARASALVCSVAVNLRDFPPLASLHRRGLAGNDLEKWERHYAEGIAAEREGRHGRALSSYNEAAAIDDHFAELLFRMARCSEALGKQDEARRFYLLARDWDALQFRTDGRINQNARTVALQAGAGAGVEFADVAERLATNTLSANGIPGQALFQEHVHFTFDGDHAVASSLIPDIAAAFRLPPPSGPGLTRADCAARLAYTEIDDYNVRSSTARLLAKPPFQDQMDHAIRQARLEGDLKQRAAQATPQTFERALASYQQALASQPHDWMIRFNYGNLLKQVGQSGAAAAEFSNVVNVLPAQRAFRLAYADALLSAGRSREAAQQFEAVLKIDPDLEPARQGLKAAKARR